MQEGTHGVYGIKENMAYMIFINKKLRSYVSIITLILAGICDTKIFCFEELDPFSVEATANEKVTPSSFLTRHELISWVLQNNPLITSNKQKIAIAKERRIQSGTWDDPIFGVETSPSNVDDRMTAIELSQTLPLFGVPNLQEALAEKEIEIAAAGLRATQLSIAHEASLLFDDLLLIQQKEAAHTKMTQILSELTAKSSFNSEDSEASLLLQLEMISLDEEAIRLQEERENILSRLSQMVNIEFDTQFQGALTVQEEFSVPSYQSFFLLKEIAKNSGQTSDYSNIILQ